MIELLVARHGLALCNVAGVVGGPRGCTGLADLGHRQSAALAARLCHEAGGGQRLPAIYASTRRRARETAEIVATATGAPLHLEPGLRDPDPAPRWDGARWREIRARLSLPPTGYPDQDDGDGEPWSAHVARVITTVTTICADAGGGRVLLVAHHETILALFHAVLGIPAGQALPWELALDHAGLSRWQCPPGVGASRWRLVAHNDTAHLPASLQRRAAPATAPGHRPDEPE